jgi:hypothetical protein
MCNASIPFAFQTAAQHMWTSADAMLYSALPAMLHCAALRCDVSCCVVLCHAVSCCVAGLMLVVCRCTGHLSSQCYRQRKTSGTKC